MWLYLDDCKADVKKISRWQVIAAIIVRDDYFTALEQTVAWNLYESVPGISPDRVKEFHASALLSQNDPFDKVSRDDAIQIFSDTVLLLQSLKVPIVYAAVDLNRLYATNYASANPIDIAFRVCVRLVEKWFKENEPDGFGLLIADETSDRKIKSAMQNAFHVFRKNVTSSPPVRGSLRKRLSPDPSLRVQ